MDIPKNTSEPVRLHLIAMDESLQVRKKLDLATVKRYAAAMAMHAEFPPIQLGRIGDGLILVDGWHRVCAARMAGWEEIEAIISTMTHEEAVWAAAGANLKHGLPLKSSELLAVFKAYVKAGEYKTGRKLKSYRQIAEDLQGQVAHTTARLWMERHFKKIYEAMGDKVRSGNGEATQPPINQNAHYAAEAAYAVENVSALANLLTDPGSRYMLIKRLEEVLSEMKGKPHEEADF
jgi:hypothetical protein